MRPIFGVAKVSIEALVDHIIADGVLTADELKQLAESISADKQVDEVESAQILRIFELISQGKLKVVTKKN